MEAGRHQNESRMEAEWKQDGSQNESITAGERKQEGTRMEARWKPE